MKLSLHTEVMNLLLVLSLLSQTPTLIASVTLFQIKGKQNFSFCGLDCKLKWLFRPVGGAKCSLFGEVGQNMKVEKKVP